jgi:hypothetical protein
LDENLPIDMIAQYLKETYNFSLTVGDLYQLKAKYYIPATKINLDVHPTKSEQIAFSATNTTI